MKNKDIHKEFSRSDVRDFLARKFEEAHRITLGRSSQGIEEEIAVLQRKLKFAKQREAVDDLAKSHGWTFWDVSDDIGDWNPETYFPFAGTESEYDILTSD